MPQVELSTPTEYEAALAEIDRLLEMEPEKGSPEHDDLQRLYALVQAYELERTRPQDPDDLPAGDTTEA